MNKIAIKNAVRSASIAAKRTANRAGYQVRRLGSKIASPIMARAPEVASKARKSANLAKSMTLSAGRRIAMSTTSAATKIGKALSGATRKTAAQMKRIASTKYSSAQNMFQAKVKSKKYYKKRLKANNKLARTGAITKDMALDDAYKYAKSKYIKRTANKVIAVGGSAVLLGYGVSESAKRIKHNVKDVLGE